MPKPRSRTRIRIAPRRANQPVLQAEHFLTPDAERGLEGMNRRISAIEQDIASRPSIDDFKQFMVGQIAEQIRQASAPKPAPISLEQELGVDPGKPLSELGDAMQRVMAGEAGPSDNALPESAPVDDEAAMAEHRQQAPTPVDTYWITRAAGKLTDGLFIGIGTVIGFMLGGVAVWKVWPWVDQITSL